MTKHLTAEAAVAEAAASVGDGYVEFEGMNCNDYLEDDADECEGWDGVSHRCDCGNRRVYWETFGDATTGFTAFACAN
jgi:hypothetical protein